MYIARMQSDIEASVGLRGPAEAVIRDLERMRESTLSMSVLLEIRVPRVGPRARGTELYTLPAIVNGDADDALRHVSQLIQQGRITPDQELRIDAAIRALKVKTKQLPAGRF